MYDDVLTRQAREFLTDLERAFGERRRWDGAGKDAAVPGPLPATLRMDDRAGKDACYPIPRAEHERNPNLEPLP